jgi:hypothetical protein
LVPGMPFDKGFEVLPLCSCRAGIELLLHDQL